MFPSVSFSGISIIFIIGLLDFCLHKFHLFFFFFALQFEIFLPLCILRTSIQFSTINHPYLQVIWIFWLVICFSQSIFYILSFNISSSLIICVKNSYVSTSSCILLVIHSQFSVLSFSGCWILLGICFSSTPEGYHLIASMP